ncbi:hypothetical protein BD779DRAFT_1649980 [Infundibulicybe gibba]|nr:hypothetical protein BD779DRAFT_1649980 [Infundibulicybe gibba]
MAAPPTYIYNIPSVRAMNPGIPAVLGDLDLSRGIASGDPILPVHLEHAESVATALKGMKGSGGAMFTDEVAKSAQLRVKAIEAAQYSAAYAPDLAGCIQFLMENSRRHTDQLNGLANQVNSLAVATINMRICTRNRELRHHKGARTQPLRKTISGPGLQLAQVAAEQLDPAVLQGILPPGPPAMIGLTPDHFNPNIDVYNDRDILRMIAFYNEDFEIVPNDSLQDRINKFHSFLCGL